MNAPFKKVALALIALALFAGCTPRSSTQTGFLPPSSITTMDDGPTPCPTCDSDGGMPK